MAKRNDAHSYTGESAGKQEKPGNGPGPLMGQGDGSTPNDESTQAETSDGINTPDTQLAGDMVTKFQSYAPGKPKRQGYVGVDGTTQDGSATSDEASEGPEA